MSEPDNMILHLLREIREDVRRVDGKVDTLDSKMNSLAADVSSDFLTLEKRLNDQMVALRRSVME